MRRWIGNEASYQDRVSSDFHSLRLYVTRKAWISCMNICDVKLSPFFLFFKFAEVA